MIAEAVELSSATIGIASPLLVGAIAFAVAWGRSSGTSSGLRQALASQRELVELKLLHIDETVRLIRKSLDRSEQAATEHRHDDNDRFADHELRLGKIEHVLSSDLTPIPRDTDRHRPVGERRPKHDPSESR